MRACRSKARTSSCRMDVQVPVNIVEYARISSADWAEDGQVDTLRHSSVSRIVAEQVSGVAERPLLGSTDRQPRGW